ncbi:MAG: hypothetical protein ACP5HG_02720 [Anaerolineae bacterium]
MLKSGGIYVNNVPVGDVGASVSLEDTVEGRFVVLRRGKKRYHLVRLAD